MYTYNIKNKLPQGKERFIICFMYKWLCYLNNVIGFLSNATSIWHIVSTLTADHHDIKHIFARNTITNLTMSCRKKTCLLNKTPCVLPDDTMLCINVQGRKQVKHFFRRNWTRACLIHYRVSHNILNSHVRMNIRVTEYSQMVNQLKCPCILLFNICYRDTILTRKNVFFGPVEIIVDISTNLMYYWKNILSRISHGQYKVLFW